MTFKTLHGRPKNVPIKPYLIDWNSDSLSEFQRGVKDFLYPYWHRDVVCEELIMAGTKLRFDLVNLTRHIVVEVNGIAHLSPKSHFHGGNPLNYLSQVKRDMKKRRWCEVNGYQLIEIEPKDLPLSRAWFKQFYEIDL